MQTGNGPTVIFKRSGSTSSPYGITNYSNIEIFLNTFERVGHYDANKIAETLIHELGHEAHAETGVFRTLSTRKNPTLAQIQAVPAFKGTHPNIASDAGGPSKGGYYGYAASTSMFNRYLK